MASSLKIQKLKDLTFIEEQNDYPSFEWFKKVSNGQFVSQGTFKFKASITAFNRELEKGGFAISRLMTASIRLYDVCTDDITGEDVLTAIYANGYPQPQDKIVYSKDGNSYRIESSHPEGTGAYIRIIANSITKGQ